MKIRFFQRLNTRLSLPFFMLLIFYIAGGFGLYGSGILDHFKDFHKQHLINVSTEKKLVIDSWLKYHKKDINKITNLNIVRNSAALLAGAADDISPRMKKAVDNARASLSLLFEDYASDRGYLLLAILSPDGKALLGSVSDITGEDWSEFDFFRQNIDRASFAGFHRTEIKGQYIYIAGFLAPVLNEHGDTIAIIYAALDIGEVVNFLKTEDRVYKSKKINIIDGGGSVLLTEEGVPPRKFRYNIEFGKNVFGYKDGLFFYTIGLEAAPLYIISTLDGSEVKTPFTVVLIAYIAFAGIIILLAVIQRSYFSRSVLRPVDKLVKALKYAAIGNMPVDTKKGYTGEMLALKISFEDMLKGVKQREYAIRENTKTAERSAIKAKIFTEIHDEIKTPLSTVVDKLNKARAEIYAEIYDKKEMQNFLNDTIYRIKSIQLLVDNLIEYVRLEDGKIFAKSEEFNLCQLFKELEDEAKEMTGSKEIEVIIDCHDLFSGRPVNTDRYRLKQILTNLMDISIKSIDAGAVTVMASLITVNSVDYAEISVAGTGAGDRTDNREYAGELVDTQKCAQSCPGMTVSKRLADILGGNLTAEGSEGRGIVFTLTIPIKTVTSNE